MKFNSDKIISYSAFIVSVGTLMVLIYQSKLMREHEEKSIFPKVELWHNPGTQVYDISVINKGVGPAIIENVVIRQGSKVFEVEPLLFVRQYLDSLTKEQLVLGGESLYPGVILTPNEQSYLFRLKRTEESNALINSFATRETSIEIYYSSIYGDQWSVGGIGQLPKVEESKPFIYRQLMDEK